MIKIGIDAMGGDFAPKEAVQGAILAVKKFQDIELHLYGREAAIKEHLTEANERLKIVHCEDVLPMEVKEPAQAVRRQTDASLVRACADAKTGAIDAVVSAGATGALIAGGTLIIRRLKEVDRPALAPIMPTIKKGKYTILCDAGATSEAKPQYLYQNAKIATIYAQEVLGVKNPKVGLLNIGTEDSKGGELQREAFDLISADKTLNFAGNIESKSMITGEVDIIVADGYSGNIAMKAVEGTASSIFKFLKQELMASTLGKLGALLAKGVFKNIKNHMDASNVGGAILLGIKAPVIKTHGSSDAIAMMNAIRQARDTVEQDVIAKISAALQKSE